MPGHRIRLVAGALTVEIAPEIGGSIASFVAGRLPLLRPGRPARHGEVDAEAQACFPMVPFVNRIRDGRYTHAGREFVIANTLPRTHPLHGHGWLGAWEIEAHDRRSARLGMRSSARDWPWRYRAFQQFELEPDGLAVTLGLESLAREAFPFSLGLHPYFPRPANALLQAHCRRLWTHDDTGIPIQAGAIPPERDLGEPRRVADLALDHCFDGWDGRATLRWPAEGLTLSLTTEGCGYLQVYSPPGEPFFCVEPMTSRPDAFNPGASDLGPIDLIEPGGHRRIVMRLGINQPA
jgi:aldose 1-epimerase